MWPFNTQKITAKAIFDDLSIVHKQAIKGYPVKLVSEPSDADLIWTAHRADEILDSLQPHQLWNHWPGENAIVNKGYLLTHLKDFDNANRSALKLADVMPESYCLFLPHERDQFLQTLPEKNTLQEPWIIKPTGLSRGKGIIILNDYDEIREFCQTSAHDDQKYVIQKYIKNVLLLEERKSEARLYWLIASKDPLLVLLYKHGTIRLNSLPYKLDEFDNNLIHISNVYQQKNHAHYDPFLTLKWNFTKLDEYLRDHYNVDESYSITKLIPRVKEYLKLVVEASQTSLFQPTRPGHFFGLYGVDIIMDDNFHPWLTEIQFGPGLGFKGDDVKKKIVPPLIKDTFKVMLEVQKRQQSQKSFHDFNDIGDYEWVIGPS